MKFQVTFDAAAPRQLGEFWALALGYITQPLPPGVSSLEDLLRSFGIPEENFGDQWALVDPAGDGPRLYFQRVPEGKTAKNRVHLDIRACADGPATRPDQEEAIESHVATLVAAGGSVLERRREWGLCVVMHDPEGNEFCVT